MRSYTLANGDKWRVILRPAVAKNTSKVDKELSREILAMWLMEGKSTGDVIARDDFWSLAAQLLGLLRIDYSEGSPSHSEILEYLQGEPEITEALFIAQNFKLTGFKFIADPPQEIEAWDPSVIIALHRFDPKKKLIEAYNHWLSIRKRDAPTDQ